jgi:DNA-binding PadR family transcriptional regulator
MTSRELSGGDYLFLAVLAQSPASAYDVKKQMASSLSFFWSAQHSQVYQQARRLQRDGYVEQRGAPAARNRRLLTLTARGEDALRRWLHSPAPRYRIYDESLGKLYFAGLAESGSADAMLADQRRQHAELLAEFEALEAALAAVDDEDVPPFPLYTLHLGIEVQNAYLRWIDATLADLERRRSR